ncbi:MAG: hypothetical protein M1828_006430 [Chrysothrix sp. TS-e1954]|nr:MAG: hypothetical protein M1828_006430 [Chrysothrix sp. TS-e1954]
MDIYTSRSYRLLCQSCRRAAQHHRLQLRNLTSTRPVTTSSQWKPSTQSHASSPSSSTSTSSSRSEVAGGQKATSSPWKVSSSSLDIGLAEAQTLSDKVINNPGIPSEADALAALQAIESATERLVNLERPRPSPSTQGPATPQRDSTATSTLLSLDAQTSKATSKPAPKKPPMISDSLFQARSSALSNLAYNLLTHPPVFISPALLKSYTTIHSLLTRPATFPEIFSLYASKPTPHLDPKSTTISYRTPTPSQKNRINTAIPIQHADTALATAIRTRSLPTSLSIISTTTSRPSFKRRRILTRASPFLAAIPLAPVAAAILASRMATYQTGMDAETFTSNAGMGVLAYMGVVGALGYTALTSANDQMRRVTWVVGMPLWERWVREEERRMLDLVVGAFGFRDRRRWGEEEGVEWNVLKEFAGVRGMIVDKVELMEGME